MTDAILLQKKALIYAVLFVFDELVFKLIEYIFLFSTQQHVHAIIIAKKRCLK